MLKRFKRLIETFIAKKFVAWGTIQCEEPIFRSDSLYRVLPEDWFKISQERLLL